MTTIEPPPRVIGLDLSLSSTGVASSLGWVTRIRITPTPHTNPLNRLRAIRTAALEHVRGVDLVVVEGPSYGSAVRSQTGHHARAGLWWLVMEAVDAAGLPWLEVSPAVVKKYATGKGNAAKDEVLAAAVRRFPEVAVSGNDEADALWLAAIGADLLGRPMLELPAAHRTALAKLALPEAVAA